MIELTPGIIATYCGLATIAFGGYSLYINGKFREISAQWKKIDDLEADIQEVRLEMVEKFATKRDLKEALDRLHEDFKDLKADLKEILRDLKKK